MIILVAVVCCFLSPPRCRDPESRAGQPLPPALQSKEDGAAAGRRLYAPVTSRRRDSDLEVVGAEPPPRTCVGLRVSMRTRGF